jgi:ribonuclease Z
MKPSVQPKLINDPFSDPGLFLPFRYEKRALLFDAGSLSNLSSGDLAKVSHLFVTHTHMDHFIGFDALLRLSLGRDKTLHVFGPQEFFQKIEGKFSAYTWNLVNEYEQDFRVVVRQVQGDRMSTKIYVCRERFQSTGELASEPFSGILLDEPSFQVLGVLLDHRTPCLGLAFQEKFYVNILKDELSKLGLPVGPWLNRLKEALYREEDPDMDFQVTWSGADGIKEKRVLPLGYLAERIAKVSSGVKISYITDVAASTENRRKICELAADSDILFIEAAFLDRDKEIAEKKYHLTAREAGLLAREAGAKHLEVFHFSPRYQGNGSELEGEAREAFEKGP